MPRRVEEDDLDKLKYLLGRVVPGVWQSRGDSEQSKVCIDTNTFVPALEYGQWREMITVHGSEDFPERGYQIAMANADFICAARNEMPNLIYSIEERDMIIHDMQLDATPAIEAERRLVLDAVHNCIMRKKKQKKGFPGLVDFEMQVMGERGKIGPLLPPDQLRVQNAKLREENERFREALTGIAMVPPTLTPCDTLVSQYRDAAQVALRWAAEKAAPIKE